MRDSPGISTNPAPTTDDRGKATRLALMEATLAQLTERGVLTGLKLREVAEAVGVTSPNIYHHFESRQRLLREALTHQIDLLTAPIGMAVQGSFVEWRTAIFDLIASNRPLRMTALLALDDDPDYEPLELWPLAQEHYQRLIDEGELPDDFDVLAAHVLSLTMAMGLSIYGGAVARQVGISEVELVARTRTMFVALMESLVNSLDEPDA